MAASQKVHVISTKYFMCINQGHYVMYLQNMKFLQSILWPGQGGHVLADMKFPVFSLCFPCVPEIFPVFFIEELTVIVIKEMSLAPSYTIYFLLKPYTA